MALAPDPEVAAPVVAAAIAAAVRTDRGRLLAALIARLGDFQAAEDALQEALEAAVVHWRRGVPASPQGWLLRVAWRKAIDRLRKTAREGRGVGDMAVLAGEEAEPEGEDIPDARLRLIFTCCHPALEPKTRVALTLRTLGRLSTAEIARAFLDTEAAMGQRLSRAKAKIKAAGIPFVIPGPQDWAERLQSVLTVIYLIFNAGYSGGDPCGAGPSGAAVDLGDEAIWLARMVDALRPGQAEVEGLLALLLITHSRRLARCDSSGALVLLEAQDRRLWQAGAIAEGVGLLDGAMARRAAGPYQIKAAIAALHVQPVTDWTQIALLYDSLLRMEPTPVIRLNRAVALFEAGAPDAALQALEPLAGELDGYQPYHAARAALLARVGQRQAALMAYDRAIALASSVADAAFLRERRLAVWG